MPYKSDCTPPIWLLKGKAYNRRHQLYQVPGQRYRQKILLHYYTECLLLHAREEYFSFTEKGKCARIHDPNLLDRTLWHENDKGTHSYCVSDGVPQSSVIGALLWNFICDIVFGLKVSEVPAIVSYSADIAVVVQLGHLDMVQLFANEVIRTIKLCLDFTNLELAEHKTKTVLISAG